MLVLNFMEIHPNTVSLNGIKCEPPGGARCKVRASPKP